MTRRTRRRETPPWEDPPAAPRAPTPDEVRAKIAHRLAAGLNRWLRCPDKACRRARRCVGRSYACLDMKE